MIWRLLRKHVPQVTSGLVRVIGIVREPGKRSVLAVYSNDPKIDPVGTCVGVRGERAKRIVADLGGREMIDTVRWDESAERFISNLLAPLRLAGASFNEATREARVRAVRRYECDRPDLALRSRLLMQLAGWKLQIEVIDEG